MFGTQLRKENCFTLGLLFTSISVSWEGIHNQDIQATQGTTAYLKDNYFLITSSALVRQRNPILVIFLVKLHLTCHQTVTLRSIEGQFLIYLHLPIYMKERAAKCLERYAEQPCPIAVALRGIEQQVAGSCRKRWFCHIIPMGSLTHSVRSLTLPRPGNSSR